MADIEEHLRSHAQAFDGLLSLIPAKYYYGEDTSDQWQRKKQTKEQARNAKRAKLDPDSAKSAKEVMDENARKRKREEGNDTETSDGELGSELPREALKRRDTKLKKQKQSEVIEPADEKSGKTAQDIDERKKLKSEKKAQKRAAKRERKKTKEASRKERKQDTKEKATDSPGSEALGQDSEIEAPSDYQNDDTTEDVVAPVEGFSQVSSTGQGDDCSTTATTPNSSNFDGPNNNSTPSSISSILPEQSTKHSEKQSLENASLKPTPEELQQRLRKRIDELRAARKADGLNGKPARNRQELIEARRQKAEQRKTHKTELRQQAKEEEQRIKDEAMVRRFSPGGTGSLLASPLSPVESNTSVSNSYSFGRIAFADGQQADHALSRLLDQPKRHGPQDPGTALKAAEAKKSRLSSFDPAKRAEIEEKDMWLNAKKRVHGEKVRDDTSLLKKALKRKESAKRKSEREWKERLEGVAKNKEVRQKQREENIRRKKKKKRVRRGKEKERGRHGLGLKGASKLKLEERRIKKIIEKPS